MTPNIEYSKFCCPNPSCKFYARNNSENIKHRSWTGKHKNIQRLKCTACEKEFSSRCGTILARSSLPVDKTTRIMKCFRWGVPDHATADICEVDADTVAAVRKNGRTDGITPSVRYTYIGHFPFKRCCD